LLTATATRFAWMDNTTYKVQAIHTQVKNGAPFFNAYFLTANKAVILYNLDKPDVQLLQKELEMAYQTGKPITFMTNSARNERKSDWYDINGY
jgi:tRNA A37 N6-isopentenylltransferase MiaA